jgi:hypothetical protein
MTSDQLPAQIAPARVSRMLTAAEFHRLSDVPPEVEWFANLSNPSTRRAYENAIRDFMGFTGIGRPEEFRTITRAHIIAWRDELARRGLGGSTIRHRLASLASATRTSPLRASTITAARGRRTARRSRLRIDLAVRLLRISEASTTTARGSTSAAITAPTGCRTTRTCVKPARLERARGSRRSAASPRWCQTRV